MSVNSREEEKRGRKALCRSKISLAHLSDDDRRHGNIQKARGPHQAWRSLQFVVNLSAFLERNGQVAIYHNTSEHRHQKNDRPQNMVSTKKITAAKVHCWLTRTAIVSEMLKTKYVTMTGWRSNGVN